jgi:hypothetical protein
MPRRRIWVAIFRFPANRSSKRYTRTLVSTRAATAVQVLSAPSSIGRRFHRRRRSPLPVALGCLDWAPAGESIRVSLSRKRDTSESLEMRLRRDRRGTTRCRSRTAQCCRDCSVRVGGASALVNRAAGYLICCSWALTLANARQGEPPSHTIPALELSATLWRGRRGDFVGQMGEGMNI